MNITQSPYFTSAHHHFRLELRDFLQTQVLPHIDQWELDHQIPKEVWRKMGELGYLGLHYPEKWGGFQKDIFYSVCLLEELGRSGYAGFRVAIAVHAYMATYYLAHEATADLQERYLLPAITGEKVAALAITEADAGTDMNSLKLTATLVGDQYVLNGRKKFVANGRVADFIIVAARTTEQSAHKRNFPYGITLFVVGKTNDGMSVRPLDCLGWHCADTCEITFNNVSVPKNHIIGQVDLGMMSIIKGLQLERLAAAFLAIGGIDYSLRQTNQYLRQRVVFNSALNSFQVIQHRMADYYVDLASIKQLAYHTALLFQQNPLLITECAMIKLKATELANTIAAASMQLHGAHGYQNDSAVSRVYRDAQAASIAAGPSEILRDIIGRSFLVEEHSS